MVSGEKYTHFSSVPPRSPEHNCQCGVSNGDRQDRLETEPCNILKNRSTIQPTGSGPICNPSFNPMPTLLQLVARSLCRSHRCLPSGLDSLEGVCQSSMESGRQNDISGSVTTSQDCFTGSSMENTTVVSNSPVHADRLPQAHHSSDGNNNQPDSSPNVSTVSRMAYLRKSYRDQQLSEETTDLMLNSWRSKTNKSYDSLFSKWSGWCSKRCSDPISGPISEIRNFLPISEIINFLASLYKDGYQYSSINSYRSAISSVHEKIDGYIIGQHPLVTRLIKGVFHARPPLP